MFKKLDILYITKWSSLKVKYPKKSVFLVAKLFLSQEVLSVSHRNWIKVDVTINKYICKSTVIFLLNESFIVTLQVHTATNVATKEITLTQ